jgi:transcriptional regulator with XRE-family HTH domain
VAKEAIQPLDNATHKLLREQFALRPDLSQAELARRAHVDAGVVSRMLDPQHRQKNVSIRALREVARELGLQKDLVLEQFELEIEITDELIEAARMAVKDELIRLKENIGRVKGSRISAIVGLVVHGSSPEKQVFERMFVVADAKSRQ